MIDQRLVPVVQNETARIETFSDGVFAIAITLLVIDLRLPNLPEPVSNQTLWAALLNRWPAYFAFVTSFASILIMWMNHSIVFYYIKIPAVRLKVANGLLLLFVVLVPITTSLVAQYLDTRAASVAAASYAGVLLLINVSYNVLWNLAAHDRRLIRKTVPRSEVKRLARTYLFGFPLYLLATVLAFWNPYLAVGMCFLLWILWALAGLDKKT